MSKTHKNIHSMPKTPEELEEMRHHLEKIDREAKEALVEKVQIKLRKKYVGKMISIASERKKKHLMFIKSLEVYEAENEDYGITGEVTYDQVFIDLLNETASVQVGLTMELDSSPWSVIRHMPIKDGVKFKEVLREAIHIITKNAAKITRMP